MVNPTWTFGVLLLPAFQFLDMAGSVDYIQAHSYAYVKDIPDLNPAIRASAPIINWHYISHSLAPVNASSGPHLIPTNTFADAPPLDYLLVPGPDPFMTLPPATIQFIQRTWASPTLKNLLTVCSGSMVIAQTGVLDGHRVASNKMALKVAAGLGAVNRNVTWVGDRRWIVDGRVWSAAGVTAGIDLAAAFMADKLGSGVVGREERALVQDLFEYKPNPDRPDAFARILKGVKLNG